MFQFHDKTRRQLAITAFFLLCLLPTCAVAGWCLWRNSSWETQIAAEQLQQQLGWKVKLGRLRYPQPGTEVYENLELLDPETGHSIFSCKSVVVSRRPMVDRKGQEKSTLVLSFEQPTLDAKSFNKIGQLTERAIQEQIVPGLNCFLSASELKLQLNQTARTYYQVNADIAHYSEYAEAVMLFQLAGAKSDKPVAIRFCRYGTVTPPRSRFELFTADNEVPCDLLALGIPEFTNYGSKYRFQGTLAFDYFQRINFGQGWQNAMNGRIFNVESGESLQLPVN